MANARGPKRASYQKQFNAKPEEKERRAALERARYAHEKKTGKKIAPGLDMDHVKPHRAGGSNSPSNLKLKGQKANRGWKGKSK